MIYLASGLSTIWRHLAWRREFSFATHAMLLRILAQRRFFCRSYTPVALWRTLLDPAEFVSPRALLHHRPARLTTTLLLQLRRGSRRRRLRPLRRRRFLLRARRHPPEFPATPASARRLRLSRRRLP